MAERDVLLRIAEAAEQIRDHLLFPPDKQPSSDADPLPAEDEAAGQPAAPTSSLPGAAGDRLLEIANKMERAAMIAKDDPHHPVTRLDALWWAQDLRELVVDKHDRPWYDDPQEIARLWRWLDEQCQLPPDVAEFIERADLWPEERERMVREQGRVTTDG